IGIRAIIKNSTFSGLNPAGAPYSTAGWQMDGAEGPDNEIINSTFNHYTYFGINFHSATGAGLLLSEPQINYNGTGVEFMSPASLKGTCGAITNNSVGIRVSQGTANFSDGSELSIVNNGEVDHGLASSSGNANNIIPYTIYLNDAKGINLNKGRNDLVSLNHNSAGIKGILHNFGTAPPTDVTIPAHNNRWNVNGTSPTSPITNPSASYWDASVYMVTPNYPSQYSSTSTYLTLIDDNPAESPLCNVTPCLIPQRPGVSIPCADIARYANCPTCELVATPYGTQDSLHRVILDAISYSTRYSASGDDNLAFTRLQSTLSTPLNDTTDHEAIILAYAYQDLEELFALAGEAGGSNPVLQNMMYEVLDERIANAGDSGIVNERFYLEMDRALVSYSSGDLSAARSSIEAARTFSSFLNEDYVDYWDCFIGLTQQLKDSTISVYDYADLIKLCSLGGTDSTARKAAKPDKMALLGEMENAAKAPVKATLINAFSLSPNPAQDNITIFWKDNKAGDAVIIITDVKGALVKQINTGSAAGTNTVTIPVAQLSNGMYFVHLVSETLNSSQKLIKSR
ncbi:MAG: T9SS type A sorting domain-containing protein, partial [Sphingobacteriales bacterium]